MLKLEKKFRNRVTGEVFSDFLDVIGDRVTLNYSFRYCSGGYRGECGKIAKKNALSTPTLWFEKFLASNDAIASGEIYHEAEVERVGGNG